MNEYYREAMIGGWHLLPEVQSERPKEVVLEKPVWVGGFGDGSTIRVNDTYCEAYQAIKAAAQETGGRPVSVGAESVNPAAAAPIDGFRVGDVVLSQGTVCVVLDDVDLAICKTEESLKLLGRPGPDGWIPHKPGDPCPVPAGTDALMLLRRGATLKCKHGYMAERWNWGRMESRDKEREIIGWRLA